MAKVETSSTHVKLCLTPNELSDFLSVWSEGSTGMCVTGQYTGATGRIEKVLPDMMKAANKIKKEKDDELRRQSDWKGQWPTHHAPKGEG